MPDPGCFGAPLAGGLKVWRPPQWRLGADTPEQLRALMNTAPYVVAVPNAVPAAACDAFARALRPTLAACNKHWYAGDHHAPGANGTGLLKTYGVAVSEPCQRMRCHAGPRRVFAALFGVAAKGGPGGLAVSLDAPCLHSVGHVRNQSFGNYAKQKGLANSTLKPHVDQCKPRPGKTLASVVLEQKLKAEESPFAHVVQGSIKATAEVPRQFDGGVFAPPGFVALIAKQPPLKEGATDWSPFDEKEVKAHRIFPGSNADGPRGGCLRYVVSPKRSLLLWRSNTVHTSHRGDKQFYMDKPESAKSEFARAMQTICCCPASARDADEREKKLALWNQHTRHVAKCGRACKAAAPFDAATRPKGCKLAKRGASTTHWPHVAIARGPNYFPNPQSHRKGGTCGYATGAPDALCTKTKKPADCVGRFGCTVHCAHCWHSYACPLNGGWRCGIAGDPVRPCVLARDDQQLLDLQKTFL